MYLSMSDYLTAPARCI